MDIKNTKITVREHSDLKFLARRTGKMKKKPP
jgi:hypothetical protein